jgi:hypothetical protein
LPVGRGANDILQQETGALPKNTFKILTKYDVNVGTETVRNTKTVLPLRRRDCDSIKKKFDYTQFMASRHRIEIALVGEAPLRTEGSTSRRL